MQYNKHWNRVWSLLVLLSLSCSAFSPTRSNSRSATRIFSTQTALPDGIIKTISTPGRGKPAKLGDIATVKYTCYLPGDEKAAPFAKSNKQKIVVGDGAMVLGWEKALRTMNVGERAIIRLTDANLGYGAAGVPPLIPPNAELEFDIELLDTQLPMANIDFDSIANMDSTPRTAADISAAYEKRQAIKALEPELEGLEYWIDKVRNYYFFGLFEGETGQQAPWFLRPSITFPIAFAVVGVTFWISFQTGAIRERGAPVTDELDEIILSMSALSSSNALMAMMMASVGIEM